MDIKDIETFIKDIFGEDIEIIRVKPKTVSPSERYFNAFNEMKKSYEEAIKDISDRNNCQTIGEVLGCIDTISKHRHTNEEYIRKYLSFIRRYRYFIDTRCNKAEQRLTDTLNSINKK